MRIPDYNLFSRYVVLAFLLLLVAGCTKPQPPPPAHDIRAEAYFQNPTLLKQAWRLPVARTYEDAFEYQINWAFCGPASLVSVFGSIDPNSVATQAGLFDQSDIWYLKARIFGLTLDELAQLARDNGEYTVEIIRDIDLDSFRQLLHQTNDPAHRYIVNFNRAALFGADIGHYSPIGGYLEEQDLVFILDVLDAYKPFLVPVELLYEAMNTTDSESGLKRGLLVFRNVR